MLRVIAEEKNMPYRKVRRAYMLYWRFIKDFMVGYQMDNIDTEEDYFDYEAFGRDLACDFIS